ncbi:hypothetical protein HKD37_19G053638 [Glycine soja]|uniref:Uncharacterized protein n=1 Tax=Glycine soja TaxID=3848 RepID=A0A0B2QLT8_GLYSO|nr:hypothetical protein glysoja_043696 [Glycine soja]
MDTKNNEEQHQKQTINNSVHKHGCNSGLHVHKLKGCILPRQLKDHSRAQEPKQSRSYERRSPIVHCS